MGLVDWRDERRNEVPGARPMPTGANRSKYQMSWQLSTDRMLRCVCVATFALSAGDPFSAVPLTCALRHRSGSEGAIDSPRSLRNRPMLRLRYLCRGVSAASSCSRILLLKTPG